MTNENVPESASPTQEGSVETVRKVYAADLREKDRVHTVFRVTKKEKVTARSGKVFVSATLVDKSGEVDARVFDKVDTLEPLFQPGDFVLVQGNVIQFHGRTQVVVEAVERLDPEPLDPKEFEPPPAPPPAEAKPAAPEPKAAPEAKAEKPEKADKGEARGNEGPGGARAAGLIREMVSERISDAFVKQLLLAFLDEPKIASGLPVAQGARGTHHAWRGGLAEHILSVMRLTLRVADQYPMADRDLLLAGALLQQVMKAADASESSDEGRLVGNLVLTAQKLREKALAIPGFPPLLEQHLTHLVISQHGDAQHGSPKSPVTLEAQIIHSLESLDARIASWLEAMQRDSHDKWTDVVRPYERQLWKGASPTSRGRAPVEGGGRRKGREEKRKARAEKPQQGGAPAEGAAAQQEQAQRPPRKERPPREERQPREERPPRPPREERPPRDASSLPRELTFKPFSALTTVSSDKGGEGSSES
ncbi:OB-fold nucleic acid binding domain-containing protein [Corallococcus macrosporus]|uniref:DNA-binding protein n=1 Tax=Corallococcus macrosporus DSM 14697 TaxID=1189310 RepID=A0A250JTK5_9BACT|nr:OB-fold nucleic acid binding domain-containing protein [Corallococcus macrosporus]ATB47165.1 DNA-binding protein [Corallococcus macrosporus DSM 14697]